MFSFAHRSDTDAATARALKGSTRSTPKLAQIRSERGRLLTRCEVTRSIETRNKVHAGMAGRWNQTKKKTFFAHQVGK